VTTRRVRLALLVVVAVTLVACDGTDGADGADPLSHTPPPPVSPTVVGPTTSPVPPPPTPLAAPPTAGPAATTCVDGWATPSRNSQPYLQPLGIIRRTTGIQGPLVVVDMRHFTGPESPPSEQGYIADVERWYVKLYAKDDPAFQGRFLVEARRFGRGVSAVASNRSHGWRSPNWIGCQWNSADTTPKAYPGLPGAWEGIPYDFVKGGGGLTIPGLPRDEAGCLNGT
jgi:hypothetical protein